MPVGTWGNIWYTTTGTGVVARTRFRDVDGVTRMVKRSGKSKGAARNALTDSLKARTTPSTTDLTGESRLADALRLWIADRERANLAQGTMRRYRDITDSYVTPGVGQLRLRECTTQRLDLFLQGLAERVGHPTARLARTSLNGALGLATRYGAVAANPMRDVGGLTVTSKPPEALTQDQLRAVRAASIHWQNPVGKIGAPRTLPLIDIVDLAIATGARIGEVLAIRWSDVDLEGGWVTIAGTIAFTDTKPSKAFRQEHPKSSSSWRELALPDHAVALLTRRRVESEGNAFDLVFATRNGTPLDPSNVRTKMRSALEPIGLGWVTPHTFRRTIATRLDAVESLRIAADQLGHSGEDVTRRHYVARAHVGPEVRHHLQELFV